MKYVAVSVFTGTPLYFVRHYDDGSYAESYRIEDAKRFESAQEAGTVCAHLIDQHGPARIEQLYVPAAIRL